MGIRTSKLLSVEFETPSMMYNDNYHMNCQFALFLLRTHHFSFFMVTNLRTFIIEKERFVGVLTPDNMQDMLLFKKEFRRRRGHPLPVKCVRFYKKVERWPYQNIFFGVGEIGLGLQDFYSGQLIHSLRAGCVEAGQRLNIYVMKYPGPARLLAAAQAQHWASLNSSNPAIVDLFENKQEKDRADRIAPINHEGTLKVFYVNEKFEYLRRSEAGPVGPEEINFHQGVEIRVKNLPGKDVFMWLIAVGSDGTVFQSRVLRVYSPMFFRNKFGIHAARDLAEAEAEVNSNMVSKDDEQNKSAYAAVRSPETVAQSMGSDEKVDRMRNTTDAGNLDPKSRAKLAADAPSARNRTDVSGVPDGF